MAFLCIDVKKYSYVFECLFFITKNVILFFKKIHMKNRIFLLLFVVITLQGFAQNNNTQTSNLIYTRQGFGVHSGIGMGIGFVNDKGITEGTPYYFDHWDTKGVIFTKKNGRFKINEVNINLLDNTLEAIYEETKVFTFDSKNLIRISVDGRHFRIFDLYDDDKILELIFKDKFTIYKYQSVIYAEKAKNPMLIRTTNKYIKKNKYYIYKNKELTQLKLSKKAFAKRFKSKEISEKAILDYIKRNKISLKDETDFIKALKFVTQ